MYEKVLVPLDGSQIAEIALPYAEEMAVKMGSEVTLLCISETAEAKEYSKHQSYLEQILEVAKREAKKYLKQPEAEIKMKTVVEVGLPAGKIIDYAKKEKIELIIMATHGRTGLSRWSLGSVAEKVLRAGTTPLLLVRAR